MRGDLLPPLKEDDLFMPMLTTLFLLIVMTVLVCIVPGPDMLYIISRSTRQGRSAGVVSCLGIATGGLLQTTAVAFGISGVFQVVPIAYDILKYVGAAYLVYLGIRFILSREERQTGSPEGKVDFRKAFLQGSLTTLLNPKVALFYIAFLPQFVDPTRGPVSLQLLILGLLFNITSFAVDTNVALLASLLGVWLKRHSRAAKLIPWLTGSVLVGLGVRLAYSGRQ
jgi:threonine/homoserine/homoserine lactone efflux protein